MIHLVTGVPGAAKTAFVVTRLDKIESTNKVNLAKNLKIYEHNKELIEKYTEDFSFYEYEIGSGHELKRQVDVLDDDYFSFLAEEYDDLRPDFYFKRTVQFNEIIQRINEREGDQGFKYFLPVRTIYTNINNLKIPFTRALTHDWRDCPDGSLIVVDEVQLVPPYDNHKDKNNDIVQSLTVHRHRGFDFYFITQSPTLLHPTVKVLVGVHYHLTRPYGMTTIVYQFGRATDNPSAVVNKKSVETKFQFRPQDRIFRLYKSTTINTHKKRFPKGIFFFLFWVFAGIAFFVYNLSGDSLQKSTVFGDGIKVDTQEQEHLLVTATEKKEVQDIAQEQRTIKEQRRLYLYSTDLPKDYEIRRADPMLQVRGVIESKGKCTAYNAYGDTMTLTQKQCKEYVGTGRVYKGEITQLQGANNP